MPVDGKLGLRAGKLGFTLAGQAGISVAVEACEDLANPNWAPVGTNSFDAQGKVDFVDPKLADGPRRFYRLRLK